MKLCIRAQMGRGSVTREALWGLFFSTKNNSLWLLAIIFQTNVTFNNQWPKNVVFPRDLSGIWKLLLFFTEVNCGSRFHSSSSPGQILMKYSTTVLHMKFPSSYHLCKVCVLLYDLRLLSLVSDVRCRTNR